MYQKNHSNKLLSQYVAFLLVVLSKIVGILQRHGGVLSCSFCGVQNVPNMAKQIIFEPAFQF